MLPLVASPLALTAGMLVTSAQSWSRSSTSIVRSAASPVVMIKVATSASQAQDDFAKDMLGRLGISDDDEGGDEVIQGTSADAAVGVTPTPPTANAKPTPRSGTEDWGSWSHATDAIQLDLFLPEGTSVKGLIVEVSKEMRMRVETGAGDELLVGTLALPVDRAELGWLAEEQDDGRKLLSVELPMLPIDTSERSRSVDCIFDESLRVNGQPCASPGLSGAGGRAQAV